MPYRELLLIVVAVSLIAAAPCIGTLADAAGLSGGIAGFVSLGLDLLALAMLFLLGGAELGLLHAGLTGSLACRFAGILFLVEALGEELAQKELFAPLGVEATFDATKINPIRMADSWRVLPARLSFSAQKRIAEAKPLEAPDPEKHYLLASGNLYLTATDLAKLTLVAWNGSDGFLDDVSLKQMHNPLHFWPETEVSMRHGMGLLKLEDLRVHSNPLRGHQGFAYGAVNGVFFDEDGNGFAALNSGASEQRIGHLALINRDLINWAMKTQRSND